MEIYECKNEQTILNWQWFEPSLRNITQLILKNIPPNGNLSLEVGCGTGRVSFAMSEIGLKVHGIDIDTCAIKLAREIAQKRKSDVEFFVGNFENLNLVEANYDVVVCSEVLEHIQDYRTIIDNMHRVLKPGGRLVVTVPYDPQKWSVLDEYGGHIRRFTGEQIRNDLKKFNITKVIVTGFPFYRLLVRAYLAKTKILKQEHSNEILWEKPSTRLISNLIYPIIRLDNLFAFTRLGDAMIVVADK